MGVELCPQWVFAPFGTHKLRVKIVEDLECFSYCKEGKSLTFKIHISVTSVRRNI